MGLTFTKVFSRLFTKKEMRILMVSARGGPFSEGFLLRVSLRSQWLCASNCT